MDLFHYTFSYAGLVVGPLIRYRTYQDYLHLPFAKSAKPHDLLRNRLMHVCIWVVGCKTISYCYPVEYILTDEFRRRHFLFKNFFNFMQLAKFKMWMTSGLYMAQCISGVLGIGAYPTSLKSVSTHGPTADYSHLKNISQKEADKLEYDYETINTLDLIGIYFAPWHSGFWRAWNRTVQYFMGRYIHKELFGVALFKDYRIVLTMFVSAYWHGLEFGFYSSMVICGVYIMAEKPYHKIFQYTTGWVSMVFLVVMWLVQAHLFGHLWISFIVLQPDVIFLHAAAMNYVPYLTLLVYYIVGKITLSYLQKDATL